MRTDQEEMEMRQVLERLLQEAGAPSALSSEETVKRRCDDYNAKPGVLKGMVCRKCRNKGYIAKVVDGEERLFECECMPVRRSMQRIRKSGLADTLDACTFDTYEAREPWQKSAKEKAVAFVADHAGKWFYIGGQVGSGKTHLCTAIVGELLKAGKAARYMLWRDEMTTLRAMRFSRDAFARRMDAWKNVEVLYIDDLLKSRKIEPFEIDSTFEIINGRYTRKDLVTIISGEKTIDELMEIDEGMGSRIAQRAKGYTVSIGRDPARNWRTK